MPINRTQRALSLENLSERVLMAADVGVAIEISPHQAHFATDTIVSETELEFALVDKVEDAENGCCQFSVDRLEELRDTYAQRYEEVDSHDENLLNAWDRLKEAIDAIDRNNPNAAATALRRAGQWISNLNEHGNAGFVFAQAAVGYECGGREASAKAMQVASAEAYAEAASGDDAS